jgi:hypothetical protein
LIEILLPAKGRSGEGVAMRMWADRQSWPVEARNDTDSLETLASFGRQPARSITSWIVLGLLLVSIILFALGHPS